MKKYKEDNIETVNDKDTIEWIRAYIEMYSTENGYRLEFFVSPNFLKVTVYKLEKELK